MSFSKKKQCGETRHLRQRALINCTTKILDAYTAIKTDEFLEKYVPIEKPRMKYYEKKDAAKAGEICTESPKNDEEDPMREIFV